MSSAPGIMPPPAGVESNAAPLPTPPAVPAPDNDEGIGSKLTGYAPPNMGPFSCSNCVHFDGSGSCDNQQVVADPEVNGAVEADGCCNLFNPSKGDNDADDAGASPEPQYSKGAAGLAAGAKFPKARPNVGV